MFNFIKNIAWYPPAETKIPWSAIITALNNNSTDFKSILCRYLDVKHCVLSESARALLYKLLVILKKRNGIKREEVLIPGYTCYSVAAAIAKAGLKIAVYDLDPKTLHPDIDSLDHALSDKTLAVIGQHFFGYLSPIGELKSMARQHGAYLIEDAAQALGKSEAYNTPGTMGDFGLFSFGRGKPLPVGCGGALVTNNYSDILDAIEFDSGGIGYKSAVVTAATQVISKPYFYWIPELLPLGLGQTVFDPEFNTEGLPRAMESMMVMSMPNLEKLNRHRKQISEIYSEMISSELQNKDSRKKISIIRYPVTMGNICLTKELNRLGVRRMYPHIISKDKTIKLFLNKNYQPVKGADEIAKKLMTLPTHTNINKKIAKNLSEKIISISGENKKC